MLEVVRNRGIPGSRCRPTLRRFETWLRSVAHELHRIHGTPNLGNWDDATDEFVFIVLSRKTAERAYLKAYAALKQVGDWPSVLRLGERRIARKIYGSGLELKKARAIVEGLSAIHARFGSAGLCGAAGMSDDDLFELIAGLPEVGPKSARCVMMYSFGRLVFPVDAHVGRVLARLGGARSIGIELAPLDHKRRQRMLEHAIPPDLRYELHVNLVAHGRAYCTASTPKCHSCPLRRRCAQIGVEKPAHPEKGAPTTRANGGTVRDART